MKKMILTVATIMITGLSMAQWNEKSINNGLDEPYKICYTAENNRAVLKMEHSDSTTALYLTGGYHCDREPKLDVSFLVNNEWVRYKETGFRSNDSKTIVFTFNLKNEEYFNSFLNSSSVKIRVNESYCTSEIYEFVMTGSTAAYNFIKTK